MTPSDASYWFVRHIGYHAFWLSSSPVWLHRDRIPKSGPMILAPTHLSPFDVPCLMAAMPRTVDFLSIVDFLKKPFVASLFKRVNCLFLNRGRVDPHTVREAVRRLKKGRALAMFPEGHIRAWKDSVVHGKPFKPGVARIAQIANAPIVPCVVLNTGAYLKAGSWLPLGRTKYGVNFGHPLQPRTDLSAEESQQDLLARLGRAYVELYRELRPKLPGDTMPPEPPTPSSGMPGEGGVRVLAEKLKEEC
jgi:1-acyl-sn-glycerol-3-phosphate acyltransferase